MNRFAICLTFAAAYLAAVLSSQFARGADDFKPPEKGKFKIVLLVGQSNMAGRGQVEEQDKTAHPRVVTLDKQGKWVPAIDPIHFDKPIAGVGLGTTFGKTLAEAFPNDTIGLVPCAFGGTSIDQWSPTKKPDPAKKELMLYADAIARVKLAQKDGTLVGILWHQGEADSGKSDAYTAKAKALFASFRKDLDAPEVPIVVGMLGTFVKGGGKINAVLQALPKEILNLACVDSTGLKDKGDSVHFDSESLREFGRRYAKAWMELAQKQK